MAQRLFWDRFISGKERLTKFSNGAAAAKPDDVQTEAAERGGARASRLAAEATTTTRRGDPAREDGPIKPIV